MLFTNELVLNQRYDKVTFFYYILIYDHTNCVSLWPQIDGQVTSRMLCPNSYGYNVMQLTLVMKFQLWLQENDHVICDRSLIYGIHWFYLGINYWWETTWKKLFHFVRMDINKMIRPGNYKIHRQDFRASKENMRPIWCLLIHF